MPSTTLKLPAELKERIAALLEGTGQTMHAFLLEAVERQAQLAERRKAFVDDALAARDEALRSGAGFTAARAHAYVRALAGGKKAVRPKASAWRK